MINREFLGVSLNDFDGSTNNGPACLTNKQYLRLAVVDGLLLVGHKR